MHELILGKPVWIVVIVDDQITPEVIVLVKNPLPDVIMATIGHAGIVELSILIEQRFPGGAICLLQWSDRHSDALISQT